MYGTCTMTSREVRYGYFNCPMVFDCASEVFREARDAVDGAKSEQMWCSSH